MPLQTKNRSIQATSWAREIAVTSESSVWTRGNLERSVASTAPVLRNGRLYLLFEEFTQFAVVEDGEAQIEEEIDYFVASNQIARRETCECFVDHCDDAGLVHLGLLRVPEWDSS